MSVISSSFRARVRAGIERPVAGVFGRLGLTPNALTLIGFGVAIVGAVLAATQSWLLAGLVVAFGAVFDLFDGALARAQGKTSKFGAFMDSVFDRAGEAVVYIGIIWGFIRSDANEGVIVATAAMAVAFMVSYTRAKSESLGFSSGSGMANVGLAPREIRTAILVIGLVGAPLADAGIGRYEAGPVTLLIALALISILATLTTIQRILYVYRQSRTTDSETN